MKIQESKQAPSTYYSTINIFPSAAYCRLILVFHALAIGTLFLAQFPLTLSWLLQVFLCFAVVVSACHFALIYRKYPCLRLQYKADEWHLIDARPDASRPDVFICEALYFWSRYLLIFKVRYKTYVRYYPVFWDCCSVDDFRRLRVIARFYMC